MLVILKKTNEVMVLGPRRRDEMAGLVFLILGLFSISILLYLFLNPDRQESGSLLVVAYAVGQYGVLPGIVGIIILYFQYTYIFDQRSKMIIEKRSWGGAKTHRFEAVTEVVIEDLPKNKIASRVLIRLRDQKDLKIGTAGKSECLKMAESIARFLDRDAYWGESRNLIYSRIDKTAVDSEES